MPIGLGFWGWVSKRGFMLMGWYGTLEVWCDIVEVGFRLVMMENGGESNF